MNVLILAGGLGTRLRSVIGKIPKPIAPIGEKPFLYYLLRSLEKYPIKSVFLSLCYEPDKVINALNPYTFSFNVSYVVEPSALGTGGGILYSLKEMIGNEAIVLNGDTFFDIDLLDFYDFFKTSKADVLVASRHVEDSGRYGSLVLENNRIIDFKEKGYEGKGLINGGIYALKGSIFEGKNKLDSFSFEAFLKENLSKLNILTKEYKNPFIDIGIPSDYKRAGDFLREFL